MTDPERYEREHYDQVSLEVRVWIVLFTAIGLAIWWFFWT